MCLHWPSPTPRPRGKWLKLWNYIEVNWSRPTDNRISRSPYRSLSRTRPVWMNRNWKIKVQDTQFFVEVLQTRRIVITVLNWGNPPIYIIKRFRQKPDYLNSSTSIEVTLVLHLTSLGITLHKESNVRGMNTSTKKGFLCLKSEISSISTGKENVQSVFILVTLSKVFLGVNIKGKNIIVKDANVF